MAVDFDQFENTAAWLEYCDGMSRFEAETEAARRQGYKRHEVINANGIRNLEGGRNNGQAASRQPADNVSRVQPASAQEVRSMFIGLILAGWGGLELLALQLVGGALV
jgi:hypothetical protein